MYADDYTFTAIVARTRGSHDGQHATGSGPSANAAIQDCLDPTTLFLFQQQFDTLERKIHLFHATGSVDAIVINHNFIVCLPNDTKREE